MFSTNKLVTDQFEPAETALLCAWKGFLLKLIGKVEFRLQIEWPCCHGLFGLTCVCLSVCWHMWDIYFTHLLSPWTETISTWSWRAFHSLLIPHVYVHVCVLYELLPKLQGLIHLSHASLGNAGSLIKDWIFHDKFAILLATCSLALSLTLFLSPLFHHSPLLHHLLLLALPSGSLSHIISHFQACAHPACACSLHVSVHKI